MAHRKIWKSILAKKLICPAFKSYEADPAKIRVFDATHELTRSDGRIKMAGIGWSLRDTEVPVENHIYKGRIDDVFARENEILLVEYVSSIYPDIFKLVDAGISGAHFRFELGEDVKTAVVSRGGITEVPDFLVETIRETIESYTYIQDLDEEALIEYANPASGFCNYCSNDLCDRNRAIRNRQPALA